MLLWICTYICLFFFFVYILIKNIYIYEWINQSILWMYVVVGTVTVWLSSDIDNKLILIKCWLPTEIVFVMTSAWFNTCDFYILYISLSCWLFVWWRPTVTFIHVSSSLSTKWRVTLYGKGVRIIMNSCTTSFFVLFLNGVTNMFGAQATQC